MKKIISSLVILLIVILTVSGCSKNTDTSDLVGRTLSLRAEGKEEVYLHFVDEDTAHFSSDVGNDVSYTKKGKNLTFKNIYFQDKYYKKLYGVVFNNENYTDNETYQYYFIGIYSDSSRTKQIAYTYPDDTIVEKYNIVKTFEAKQFSQTSHDAPNFLPDAHETPAELSSIDEIALDFFNNIKSLKFQENYVCIATTNNNDTLIGSYSLFNRATLYLNFGEEYHKDGKYIEMRVYENTPVPTPGYSDDNTTQSYDPNYSNLTPPPYFENDGLYLYWEGQDSTFIIR